MMRSALSLILAVAATSGAAQEAEPLSAIDWLSQSVESAATASGAQTSGVQPPLPDPDEAPVANSAATPEISVRPIDQVSADALGLLPHAVTGLPDSLWQGSDAATLATLISAETADTLPALRDLLTTLLLARADPPANGDGTSFFLARVDRLLELGSLDPAQALLEQADRADPDIFRRWFDVTLLTGSEDDSCRFMEERPALAPTYPARIFCLARLGDWNAAALTLGTARALGDVTGEDEALLVRFLDSEMDDTAGPLPPPTRPTPLVYRLREAIGEPIPATGLPRAFAHADMRPVAPWRSQLEAAERLARVGAVSPNVLFDLYRQQTPAASGGVWDRAAAVQALDAALAEGAEAVAEALPLAWDAMAVPRAEVAFASHYGPRLMQAGLTGDAQALAWRIALLSPDYEQVAQSGVPDAPDAAVLAAIATGDVTGIAATGRASAVIAGFSDTVPEGTVATLLDDGKLGEALLRTLAAMAVGLEGDPQTVAEGLAVLRRVGLEDTARRAALQYLILDRGA